MSSYSSNFKNERVKVKIILDSLKIPLKLLTEIKTIAFKTGIKRIALTGGVVRDTFLKENDPDFLINPFDIDLIVEGSASKLAEELQKNFGEDRLKELHYHKSFNTIDMKLDGFSIDITTARKEKYAYPGHNPQVFPSQLEKDLARRDFTINSIAIDLKDFSIVDIHNGRVAIKEKKLEFLHNKSVLDDPTRVIRGARYASRLGFTLTAKAKKQIKSTLKEWPWILNEEQSNTVLPAALTVRLRQELELLLTKEPWEQALNLLQEWGALSLLEEGLQQDQTWKTRLQWAFKLNIEPLTALIAGAKDAKTLASRLQLPYSEKKFIEESIEIKDHFSSDITLQEINQWPPSRWCEEIESKNWDPKSVALEICMEPKSLPGLIQWWAYWRKIKSPITAKELMQRGWKSGPKLGLELKRLRLNHIDKENIFTSIF